jgi:hypothetical protein
MAWVVIFGGGIAIILLVAWFTLTRQHPEEADRHADDRPHVDPMGRGTRSPGVVDRPAGPDAESMVPEPRPKPSPPGEPDARDTNGPGP